MARLTKTPLLLFPTLLLSFTPLTLAKDMEVRFEAASDWDWSEGDMDSDQQRDRKEEPCAQYQEVM
jgi:hypothetical protein